MGEAGSVDRVNVELCRNALPMVLAVLGARPEDVFNANETSIVLGSQPTKTMAFSRVSGVKKEKDRISLMRCCNATGTERLKPVIIAKPARPRCFGAPRAINAFDPATHVHYFSHTSAYMSLAIFNTWLSHLQVDLMVTYRTIYLVIDNCSAHGVTLDDATEQVVHGIKVISVCTFL